MNYDDDANYDGWLISEKLDGVRCIFYMNKLKSRTGHTIHAPTWFIRDISDLLSGTGITMLDGELYTKRNDFQRICSIVKKETPDDKEWRDIRYMVFDTPLENIVFRERYSRFAGFSSDYVEIVKQYSISDMSSIRRYLDEISTNGGEGVMLRDPSSYYEQKRSKTLVKCKKFMDDDALILSVVPGKGKYSDAIGGFKVGWVTRPHIQFNVGTGLNDIIRHTKDKESFVGKIVKIKYYTTTDSGKPRFPVFIGFRE